MYQSAREARREEIVDEFLGRAAWRQYTQLVAAGSAGGLMVDLLQDIQLSLLFSHLTTPDNVFAESSVMFGLFGLYTEINC